MGRRPAAASRRLSGDVVQLDLIVWLGRPPGGPVHFAGTTTRRVDDDFDDNPVPLARRHLPPLRHLVVGNDGSLYLYEPIRPGSLRSRPS
jgi:hypothetical protein